MNRQLVLGAACAGLIAATALPTHAAGKPAACTSFADAKGDSGPPNDAALDITGVTVKSVGKTLVSTVTLDAPKEQPAFAPGNRVEVSFRLAERAVTLYYKYSPTRDEEANVFYQQGIRVDEVFYSDALEAKVDGNKVVIAVTFSTLGGAVEKKVPGQEMSGLSAAARGSYVATNQTWDTATAPATMAHRIGAACK